MTFNDNSKLDTSRVSKRGKTGIAVGGGGAVVVIGLFLLSQVLGVDLTGLAGGTTSQSSSTEEALDCQTGADANARVECLMVGASNSLDSYWQKEAPQLGVTYQSPADFVLFDGSTSTGCGQASSATGPFYCPPDQTIYVDTSFFDELRNQFGATGGTLSEMYVVAHEWGHHIQQIAGTFAQTDRSGTGAASDSVRTELQADCYAGAWAASASQTTDVDGNTFLKPITQQQIADALNAASAIGDDRIQQQSGGAVNSESWTHGSSEQRQRWFTNGFSGGAGNCDTFAAADGAL
ncbi:KPN_02809 family neutral zinc metallopeptidase [Subtercola boreus]|uniref:Neutral zinc metallopeptidase n=1 Tax=Subtercola boreus TaxID=120213 RepID=A0A3E0W6A9_9MICO|nr:neutral zinc metallopeptidase [Subtercola boreus]RFA18001.1 neutral zinc metallopeptidase [Subtercola boreus]RFA18383.1 neutral zinc metallopeptidase [Subtercola boreus]RFA24912.1 neutral zinc metallopeptidase [Subtercola boreus]